VTLISYLTLVQRSMQCDKLQPNEFGQNLYWQVHERVIKRPTSYMHIWQGEVSGLFRRKTILSYFSRISFHYLEIFLDTWIDIHNAPNTCLLYQILI
jgi:hypothetical protein